MEVSDLYGLKVTYIGIPKSQQYSNGYFLRESTCLAPKGTKAKTEEELAEGAMCTVVVYRSSTICSPVFGAQLQAPKHAFPANTGRMCTCMCVCVT